MTITYINTYEVGASKTKLEVFEADFKLARMNVIPNKVGLEVITTKEFDIKTLVKIIDINLKVTNNDKKFTDRAFLLAVMYQEIKEIADKTCSKLGVEYKKIEIVDAQDTINAFASCNKKEGTLKFYWKLIEAPKWFLETTVIHECCHLIHDNHSDLFWDLNRCFVSDELTRQDGDWMNEHNMDFFLAPIGSSIDKINDESVSLDIVYDVREGGLIDIAKN